MANDTDTPVLRKPADWMQPADERILEFLRAEGNHQPSRIAEGLADLAADVEYHPNHVGRRCRMLAAGGLLLNEGNGVYAVTETGERFLDGEVDAATLAVPDEVYE